jgi:hypothetical protein
VTLIASWEAARLASALEEDAKGLRRKAEMEPLRTQDAKTTRYDLMKSALLLDKRARQLKQESRR